MNNNINGVSSNWWIIILKVFQGWDLWNFPFNIFFLSRLISSSTHAFSFYGVGFQRFKLDNEWKFKAFDLCLDPG